MSYQRDLDRSAGSAGLIIAAFLFFLAILVLASVITAFVVVGLL